MPEMCRHCGLEMLDGEIHGSTSMRDDGAFLVKCEFLNQERSGMFFHVFPNPHQRIYFTKLEDWLEDK